MPKIDFVICVSVFSWCQVLVPTVSPLYESMLIMSRLTLKIFWVHRNVPKMCFVILESALMFWEISILVYLYQNILNSWCRAYNNFIFLTLNCAYLLLLLLIYNMYKLKQTTIEHVVIKNSDFHFCVVFWIFYQSSIVYYIIFTCYLEMQFSFYLLTSST